MRSSQQVLIINSSCWNFWFVFSLIGSVISWFICAPLYTRFGVYVGVCSSELKDVAWKLFLWPGFWLACLTVPLICMSKDYILKL